MNIVSKKIIMLFVILGIFLLPISPSLEMKKNGVAINSKINKALAASVEDLMGGSTISVNSVNSNSAKFNIKMVLSENYRTTEKKEEVKYYKLYYNIDKINYPKTIAPSVAIVLTNKATGDITKKTLEDIKIPFDTTKTDNFANGSIGNGGSFDIKLTPATNYSVHLWFDANVPWSSWDGADTNFTTLPENSADPEKVDPTTTVKAEGTGETLDLNCGFTNISGCFAEIFYLFFKIAAFIGKLAAWFLDFFVYYSTDSNSYVSDFIAKGWAAIRDVANIFFIIALLYIAIKTILGLNVSDNKKIISFVIIFGLLINFSLFFTKVVIDSSNIVAKIFYNNITISNQDSSTSTTGEKSISVAVISKFNPQKLVTQDVYNETGGVAMFIFITILATFVVLYAAYIFFSIALLFVGRVVSLWISMIFSPIAFASFALPFEIKGMGHKDWWSELSKNAILAPIFIFFLYIITMFTSFLSSIVKFPENADFMQKIMAVMIPFAILTVLLMKAKKLAVEYAGEMGAAVSKVGAMVGGLAVGAASGGAAFLGRNVIGGVVGKMANSAGLAKLEAGGGGFGKAGKMLGTGLRNVGKTAGKGSFDVRGIKIAGKDLSSTGLKVGKAGGQGGYEKAKANKVEKRQARKEELKKAMGNSKEAMALKKTQEDLQAVTNSTNILLEDVQKKIDATRVKMTDAKTANRLVGDNSVEEHNIELEKLKKQQSDIKDGYSLDKNGEREVAGQKVTEKQVDDEVEKTRKVKKMVSKELPDGIGGTRTVQVEVEEDETYMEKTGKTKTVEEVEIVYKKTDEGKSFTELKDLEKDQKRTVEAEVNKVVTDYAEKISTGRKGLFAANKKAAHDIKMGVVVENKGH